MDETTFASIRVETPPKKVGPVIENNTTRGKVMKDLRPNLFYFFVISGRVINTSLVIKNKVRKKWTPNVKVDLRVFQKKKKK